jgi:hypothetical protein
MSFTTRHTGHLIAHPTLFTGGITLPGGQNAIADDETPTLTEDGFDTLRKPYILPRATLTPEDLATLFPQGAQLGTRKWWLTTATPTRLGPGLWRADVEFKGWATTKPAKIRIGTTAAQQSAQNILAPTGPSPAPNALYALYAKVATQEATPSITATYLVENTTTTHNTDKVGRPLTPPVTIALAPSIWDFLTQYVWNWPQGWVLSGSEQDRLPGTAVALVTDTYQYIRPITPG